MFLYCTKVDAKLAELAPLSYKFDKRSCVGIFATSAPDPPHLTQNSSFGCFGLFRYRTKLDAKLAKLVPLTHKFTKQSHIQIFLQRTHQTLSIRPKTHVVGCFRPFRYCTKVDAKLAELAPLTYKFAKRSCVGIFRNEHT
jgi:hypothetical protein